MNREDFTEHIERLQKLLNAYGEKTDLTVTFFPNSTGTEVTIRVSPMNLSASGNAQPDDIALLSKYIPAPYIRDWETNWKSYGFNKDDWARRFKMGDTEYILAGLSSNNHKYPVIIFDVKKRRLFKNSVTRIQTALAS